MQALITWGLFLVALVALWAIGLRPARRQREQMERLQNQLQVGDEVVTASGIFGRIAHLSDERVGVVVAPSVVIEIARRAIVAKPAERESMTETDGQATPAEETSNE